MKDLHWRISTDEPTDWGTLLEKTGAGVYHSYIGLILSDFHGEPLYCTLHDPAGEVVGIALGSQRRCRLSTRPRHITFSSLPAFSALPDPEAALASLIATLQADGAAEVDMATYDTTWVPTSGLPLRKSTIRQEYVVPIDAEPQALRRSFATSHRRYASRGERQGWELRTLTGPTAVETLKAVTGNTARRIRSQGRDYMSSVPIERVIEEGGDSNRPGRAITFAAFEDGQLLGAALVGFAGRRGYLVIAGSTPGGYRKYSATWLYWRIMGWLHERGANAFNLGGSPGSPLTASDPDDPHHGLYSFKMGFGARIVRSHPCYFELAPFHLRLHRLTSRQPVTAGT